MLVNPAKEVAISSRRKRRSMPLEATSRGRRAGQHGRGMRIRALCLIMLIAAWLVPAGGGACPADTRGASGHAHAASGHEHGDPGSSHAHAVSQESETRPDAPAESPRCCSSDPKPAVLTASAPAGETQRLKSMSLELPALALFESFATPARNRLRLPGGRPPPLEPFARTRRPLLI
jgi:hypothetical protein